MFLDTIKDVGSKKTVRYFISYSHSNRLPVATE